VRRELAARLNLEAKSWKILLEILAKAPSARVAEVPYTFRRRASGRSKLGVKAIFDYVLDLLRLSNYRILKFAAVGASGVAVNLAALEAAYVRAGLPDYLSYLASWEVSLTWNYVLHDSFTFRGARPPGLLNAVRYWLLYHLAAAASWAAYMATALSLHRLLGVDYRAAALAGIALGFIANFAISQHKVWNDARRT
jgi:dolichol-phosphate mannosyltransferase